MKLHIFSKNINIRLLILFALIVLSFSFNLTLNNKLKIQRPLNTVERFKFLFMMKLPSVKNQATHPLNVLNYKNILFSTSQLVFFVSTNPSIPVINIFI